MCYEVQIQSVSYNQYHILKCNVSYTICMRHNYNMHVLQIDTTQVQL